MQGRKHGEQPYQVVVVHGGPGAPGSAFHLAKGIQDRGVIEPFQTKLTVNGQIAELVKTIKEEAAQPVTLIGHSWGAMLCYLVAAKHSELVKKLILVCSGGFTAESYQITRDTRMARLNDEDRTRANEISLELKANPDKEEKELLLEYYDLISKADFYDPITMKDDGTVAFQNDVNKQVWAEAIELRESGELLESGKDIQCEVVALHGDYDPHPINGVEDPLRKTVKQFKMITIPNCGHEPWKEKQAKEEFFRLLNAELVKR